MKHIEFKQYRRCYEDHQRLDLGIGITLYGGSCLTPIISQADIYVGLEQNMSTPQSAQPWRGGCSVSHVIQNMGIPKDKEEFVKMIDWLAKQLLDHKEIHVGCIGGHGRTGMVLSSLKYVLTQDKSATEYIRQAYCKKAVETVSQVDFLYDLYGIEKVAPVEKYKNVGVKTIGGKVAKKIQTISHLGIVGNIWD